MVVEDSVSKALPFRHRQYRTIQSCRSSLCSLIQLIVKWIVDNSNDGLFIFYQSQINTGGVLLIQKRPGSVYRIKGPEIFAIRFSILIAELFSYQSMFWKGRSDHFDDLPL